MVDAEVKGASSGTSTNPSFSLRETFEHQIIPLLEKLVGPPAACGDKEKHQEEKSNDARLILKTIPRPSLIQVSVESTRTVA